MNSQYTRAVTKDASNIEKTKGICNFKDKGKTIKKVKEGITIIIILYDKSIVFWESFVSQYNHIKARKDVRGIEAISPAKSDERLAISEITTTTKAVIKVLINRYSI